MEAATKNHVPKNIFLLGLTSFFTDVHSEIILPLLPLFLTNVLKASTTYIGLIEGIAESTSNIVKGFSGYLSDLTNKRKNIIVFGYVFSFISKAILPATTSVSHVLGLRFADRIGKGIRTSPRDALIADSTHTNSYGYSFGVHRAMDTLGAIVGAGLASILMLLLAGNIRAAFAIAAIPGIFAILSLFFVKETRTAPSISKKITPVTDENNKKPTTLVFAGLALFYLSNISYAFYILKLNEMGFSQKAIPIAYLIYNIVYAVLSIPAGRLSDRIGRKRVIIMGIISHVFLCFGFGFAKNTFYGWMLFVLYGIVSSIVETVPKAFISDISKKEKRGSAFGGYNMIIGISTLAGNFLAGYLWDSYGADTTFFFAGFIAFLSIIFFVRSIK